MSGADGSAWGRAAQVSVDGVATDTERRSGEPHAATQLERAGRVARGEGPQSSGGGVADKAWPNSVSTAVTAVAHSRPPSPTALTLDG